MPTPFELRDELEAAALAELLGPADGPTEIVEDHNLRDRYLVGRLAPKGQSALPEESDEALPGGPDEEDGVAEAPPPKAVTLLPSSLGLTFAVSGAATALQLRVSWGRYERIMVSSSPATPESAGDEAARRPRAAWQRIPVAAESGPLPLQAGRLPDWAPDPEHPEVVVQGLIRQRAGRWIVTLFLVNGQSEPPVQKDSAWLFQPELSVAAPDGAPVFERPPQRALPADLDQQFMALLYRHEVPFAVGHGVAVHADRAPGQPERAVRLTTTFVPTYDVAQVTAPSAAELPALAGLVLEMRALAAIPDGGFTAALTPLATAYADWIEMQAARLVAPLPDLLPYLDVARLALERCRTALVRIRAGIALLDADPQAAAAFRFANQAMYLQRLHTALAAAVRQGEATDLGTVEQSARHEWRVFQLAFILLNLPGLTDLHHPDRSGPEAVADLLWFPTGGGKTEAYLGVTAYVLALRRLQGVVAGRSGHAGVAVLMRYTLRLLTLQQFQRATALICACEIIRRADVARWGDEPFRIGLWVGRRSTPNWTKDADEAVKQLKKSAPTREGTPYQLTYCPWCGTKIEPGRDLSVELPERGRGRTLIYCGDPLGRCPFSRKQAPEEGLPVLVVDEEIYRRLPALLIATVDKFAQLPWNGRTAMLFGQVDGYCERHGYRSPDIEDSASHPAKGALPAARTLPAAPLRPPDLIIQDELHLISGPLGTLVGLYETAVDQLATWEVDGVLVRPKVIASTATIRRADTQVHSLFLRQVALFPPYGLEADDNFFARRRPPSEEYPGRRYLGLCAPGIRFKTALIQAYVAFLAAAQALYNRYGAAADPWLTLVGYFNSLRELGGMRRAVDDTVTTRLRQIARRGLAKRYLDPWKVEELTSRRSAADIPRILDRLEAPFQPRLALAKGKPEGDRWPIDLLLATNMISVGVDVSRLGLMVVANQPKNTAEYIQATSRVGRRYPGLICTVYNWTRPRDLSHYESFEHYHATFYQHVEALSVTPFSPQALTRGLSAVLVALVRLAGLELNANHGAEKLTQTTPLAQAALAQIVARAAQINGLASAELVRESLQSRLDEWLSRIPAHGARLGYQEERDGVTTGLLSTPGLTRWDTFTCLNSLRDVEPTVNLLLDDYGLDRPGEPAWDFEPAKEGNL